MCYNNTEVCLQWFYYNLMQIKPVYLVFFPNTNYTVFYKKLYNLYALSTSKITLSPCLVLINDEYSKSVLHAFCENEQVRNFLYLWVVCKGAHVHAHINERKSQIAIFVNMFYFKGAGWQRFGGRLLMIFLVLCLNFFLLSLSFNTFGKIKQSTNKNKAVSQN